MEFMQKYSLDEDILVVLPYARIRGKFQDVCDGFLIVKDRCDKIYAINIDKIIYITSC